MLTAGCSDRQDLPIEEKSVLRVAMDLDMPGFFIHNGQNLGYTYDLLDAYAQSFGLVLEIVPGNTPQACAELLNTGELDMAATLHYPQGNNHVLIPLYETSYVVLATSKKARAMPSDGEVLMHLDGKNILFSGGFSATQSYQAIQDMLPGAHFIASGRHTFDQFEALINGKCDVLICEQSEAQLGCSLVRNIEEIYRFDESVSVCMLLNGTTHPEEGRRFASWVYDFRHSKASGALQALYFEKGIYHRIIPTRIKNDPTGATSHYDGLFQKLAREEELDWRLVSAIAYSESKYNAYMVSPRGARGLMQVMPATAEAFQVPLDELMEPETNIRVAVRLIRRIEESLNFAAGTSQNDRTRIILACYNGGIGHVTDARRLAAKHGGDPDSWSDVSRYLELKALPEYANDEVVKCGTFRGASETLNFVNHVMGSYYAYCAGK